MVTSDWHMNDDVVTVRGRGYFRMIAGKYWKLSLAFAVYMYYYLTAELTFTELMVLEFGAGAGTLFYGFYCLAGAAGFFGYGLTRMLVKGTGGRCRLLCIVGVFGVGFTLSAPFAGGSFAGAFTLAAMLAAGYAGGELLCNIAVCVREKSTLGIFIAAPYSAAFLLQFLFGYVEPFFGDALQTVTHIVLAAAFAVCVFLLLAHGLAAPDGNPSSFAKKPDAKKYLWGAVISCLIISCLYGLMDGIIMLLHSGQELDVWSGTRLLTIPGMLSAAWFADYKHGKYFPFATLIAMVMAVSAVLLWREADTWNLALGAVYFFFSFMSIYSLAIFVRVASDTDKPGLWAAAGRGVKYAAGGAFALLGSFVFENISLLAIELLYLALLIILACVFFFQGRLGMTPDAGQRQPAQLSRGQTFEEMVAFYGITEREAEALRFLLKAAKTSDIASAMFVVEGTVYKYISSMITKTGRKNRAELIALFSRAKD